MNRKEVLKKLLRGDKIRLPNWGRGVYLYMTNSGDIKSTKGAMWELRQLSGDAWELYKEPVKYSVEVWLYGNPKSNPSRNDILDYLFGEDTAWRKYKVGKYRKYKITIEEVEED